MEELLKVVIPALIGLIAGIVGSLVAPWVNWGIEKRKQKLNAQRDFIANARRDLLVGPTREEFRESAIYSQLRAFLSERARKQIESDNVNVQMGGRGAGVNNYRPMVLDDLRLLEKKWKLL